MNNEIANREFQGSAKKIRRRTKRPKRTQELRSQELQEFRRDEDRLEAYATLGVSRVRLGRQQCSIGVPPVGRAVGSAAYL